MYLLFIANLVIKLKFIKKERYQTFKKITNWDNVVLCEANCFFFLSDDRGIYTPPGGGVTSPRQEVEIGGARNYFSEVAITEGHSRVSHCQSCILDNLLAC